MSLHRFQLSSQQLILFVALWMSGLDNLSYYRKVLEIYPLKGGNLPFLGSIEMLQLLITLLLLGLIGWRPLLKPLLTILLIAASVAAYFMDSYGTMIDMDMIRNTLETNVAEARELFSGRLLLYLLLLGILPSILVWRVDLAPIRGWRALWLRLRLLVLALLGMGIVILVFYKPYSSFFREHKPVRFYSNPIYFLYSGIRYASGQLFDGAREFHKIGSDARLAANRGKPRLVILVVGETARADHFSLNGYERNTNPLLQQRRGLINFSDFSSCGTSTAISVPCMFSRLTRDNFSDGEARNSDNVLDILQRAGVDVLWLDNNSSSKGVAVRVPHEDYRKPGNNPVCNPECRDEGMLVKLPQWIARTPGRDKLIVLHQMGNHGPAYYKRYPAEFERFQPVCQTNELDQCSVEAISNAYDNAILYTDFVLDQAIDLLQQYDSRYVTALWYMSDHGESLGENGIYLHGLPYFLAPEAQTHVPSVLWLGRNIPDSLRQAATGKRGQPLSHDNLFHSLLGLFGVETAVHDPRLDIFFVSDNPS